MTHTNHPNLETQSVSCCARWRKATLTLLGIFTDPQVMAAFDSPPFQPPGGPDAGLVAAHLDHQAHDTAADSFSSDPRGASGQLIRRLRSGHGRRLRLSWAADFRSGPLESGLATEVPPGATLRVALNWRV